MPSPFPGMDLYLESPDVWSDFHGTFLIDQPPNPPLHAPDAAWARELLTHPRQ